MKATPELLIDRYVALADLTEDEKAVVAVIMEKFGQQQFLLGKQDAYCDLMGHFGDEWDVRLEKMIDSIDEKIDENTP